MENVKQAHENFP